MKKLRLVLLAAVAALTISIAHASPVDVNNADAEVLAAGLAGVGPAIAERIVAYREEFGPFRSAEDLLEVRGIGPATLENIRDNVEFGDVD
jgi:competence protein ComEA